MDLAAIDPRLLDAKINVDNVVWKNALSAPITLHGVYYDEEKRAYRRMREEIAATVNPGVRGLSASTSGGRVRFRTDSPYVAVRALMPMPGLANHMSLSNMCGFALYVDGEYGAKYTVTVDEALAAREEKRPATIAAMAYRRPAHGGFYDCEIYFPLYGGVKELHIGIAEGHEILPPRPYTYEKPIVFYGSSITQGACASRPGNDYIGILSRMLDSDIVNLGFSGNGNAEPTMLEYLCSLDAGMYVFDYNYYLDRPERNATMPKHYDVYRTLRDAHPDVPIMMMDKPATMFSPKNYEVRNAMIKETYERALAEGDTLVGYIDSAVMMGEHAADCFVDSDHPNDHGFHRMADSLYPILKDLLERAKK